MKKTQARIEQLRQRLGKVLANMPEDLAIVAEDYTLERFEKEDWDGRKWPQRQRDPEAGAERENRRNLLVKSGNLRRSIRREVVRDGFFLISNEDYAQIHNEGGTIQHPGGTDYIVITEGGETKTVFVRKRKGAELRKRNRFVGKTKPHPITIPKRQFIGKSKRLSVLMRRRFIKLVETALK
jgi:Phage virion morphogenesis family.